MGNFSYESGGVRIERKKDTYYIVFTPAFNGDRTIPLSEKDFLELTEREDDGKLSKILKSIDPTLIYELREKELGTINSALLGAREIYDKNLRI